jgi:hypothetical protein
MFTAYYQENEDLPSMIGKYRLEQDAADAAAVKEQTLPQRVNPYWIWIEETE